MIDLKKGEKIEDLQCRGLKIIQNKNWFCFGMDAVLLANYCELEDGEEVVDLGTGTGIMPILLYGKNNVKKIFGIEIQKEVAEMAERSIKLNEVEGYVEIININIKDYRKYLKKNHFDTVISNPPYIKTSSNLISPEKKKALSRHEIEGNLEDFIRTAAELLKHRGKYYMVYRPNRLVEVFQYMKKYKIEPKKIRFVQNRVDEDPNLVLIKGVKAANSHLLVEKPLIIFDERGNNTEELNKIYSS
ncbi:MAG: tRNA1(Val) (adenine(37)-N6)-methyltransferase [bacterium]